MVWANLKVPVVESMLKIPPPFPDTIAQVPVDWPVSVPTTAPLVALLSGRKKICPASTVGSPAGA